MPMARWRGVTFGYLLISSCYWNDGHKVRLKVELVFCYRYATQGLEKHIGIGLISIQNLMSRSHLGLGESLDGLGLGLISIQNLMPRSHLGLGESLDGLGLGLFSDWKLEVSVPDFKVLFASLGLSASQDGLQHVYSLHVHNRHGRFY